MFASIKKKLYLCNLEIKIITTASLKPKQVPKAWARNYDNNNFESQQEDASNNRSYGEEVGKAQQGLLR